MKTILVADDNAHIRMFCKQQLEGEGYRVVLAPDGGEAVLAVQSNCVDLAILDVRMPAVGGIEAAERIKAIAPALPIVFFTANGRAEIPRRWTELAVACLEKSEDLGELKRLCATVLQSTDDQFSRSETAMNVK